MTTWTSPPPRTEPPEVLIGWAITCMRENHVRGWHEIAGTGGFADCLPDGSVATRIGGLVEQHGTVESAALRLAQEGDQS
ncbi:MAG: hypothetical protein J2P30_00200 [Actinobacteria bacterium]|nr:hypothetical protein [Actinomycetota bacterium]